MPVRPSVLSGTSTSPRTSSNNVIDRISVLPRKLAQTHVEHSAPPSTTTTTTRRTSFSMDNILHPGKKDKKHDEKDAKKEKRNSLVISKDSKTKDKHAGQSPRMVPARPGKLDLIVESPPLVFYGNMNNSTGALFSGRMKLLVEDPTGKVTLNKFTMVLRAVLTTKKPISKDCKNCSERVDELKRWDFLSEAKTFIKDKDNQFPFSYLFEGHLPATTNAHLGSINYSLHATATTTTGEEIVLAHPLKLQRALVPGPEKSSIRIFPPTNLTGRVSLPSIVHPIGAFPVSMTLSGVVERKSESQTRWRLRKMMWRIEEQTKIISSPCSKHSNKVSEGKAMQHTDTQVLGNDELKSGWKTDFDTVGGEIALEFEASLATKSSHKAICDVDSQAGLEVRHNLIIELIVAEEFCPNKNTSLITPTGAARVLRMQFALNVTERAGMGISWDEEMPPMYEDVPPSPPGYGSADPMDGVSGGASIEDYNGPELECYDLVRLPTANPTDPPIYRERDFQDVNAGLPMRTERRRYDHDDQTVVESSTRNRLQGLRMQDLEEETPQERARRLRLEAEAENESPEEDYGEGVAQA